jgi:hypothetical protein
MVIEEWGIGVGLENDDWFRCGKRCAEMTGRGKNEEKKQLNRATQAKIRDAFD